MHLPVSEPFLNTNENENQAREGGGGMGGTSYKCNAPRKFLREIS